VVAAVAVAIEIVVPGVVATEGSSKASSSYLDLPKELERGTHLFQSPRFGIDFESFLSQCLHY
jgi:hypothetical protein